MRMLCWGLLGLSVVLFLLGVVSKFAGVESHVMGFEPVAWWRAAMAAAIYAMALKIVGGEGAQHPI